MEKGPLSWRITKNSRGKANGIKSLMMEKDYKKIKKEV